MQQAAVCICVTHANSVEQRVPGEQSGRKGPCRGGGGAQSVVMRIGTYFGAECLRIASTGYKLPCNSSETRRPRAAFGA